LRKGDKSSADGVVLEGEERCMEFGRASTYIGAKVHCPACKTVGTIAAKGPRWPDSMFGKEQALEGDICLCKCNPPPVMIASQNRSFHKFSAGQLADMGNAGNDRPSAKYASNEHWVRFLLTETGSCQGLRCRAYFADGSVEDRRADASNTIHFDRPNTSPCHRLEAIFEPPRSLGKSALGSILAAMGV
jgi:hypothetical protein